MIFIVYNDHHLARAYGFDGIFDARKRVCAPNVFVIVIFGAGDEILGGLMQFAEENHISAARITGIGSIHNGTLAWLNPDTKKFRMIHIDQQAEVLSLLGDIAMYQGKPVVHVHMVVGFGDGTAHGGHLLEAHVWPTLEVIVTSYPRPLYKKFDPEKGIAVIDPSMNQ